jgi:rubrerythrin
MTEPDDTTAIAERIAESVKGQIEETGSSRRKFMAGSALAGGGLLGLGSGIGLAQEDDEAETSGHDGTEAMFDDVGGTDIDVLNYALTLEHLENAFYREAFETYDRETFNDADIVQNYSTENDQSLYTNIEVIGEHEATHVEVLEQAVQLLGGDPVSEATYDFGIDSVETFLGLAQVFENTGVAAYAGAAPFIESPDMVSAALSIRSVEARHAAYLNDINGALAYPDAFDSSLSQQEVLDAVGPFIDSDGGGDGSDGSGQ